MSPLSDWRLPFSGFSSLSLQNKERPFQKSGFHSPGGKLPSGWEGKQQEGGVRDTRERNSEDDLTWESCPGAPPHTWTSPHRILSLFQQFFLVNRQLSVPIYLVFFFPFCFGQTEQTEREGDRKGNAGKDFRGLFSHQGWCPVFSTSQRETLFILQNSGQRSGSIYLIFLLRWVGEAISHQWVTSHCSGSTSLSLNV